MRRGRRLAAGCLLAWGLFGCRSDPPAALQGGASPGADHPIASPVGASSAPRERIEAPATMPAAGAFVLERPERFEILTVEPSPSPEDRAKAAQSGFHGYPVTGRADVADERTRERVVATIYEGIRSSDGSIAMCFNPRHGVRAVREGKTVDLLICYECRQVKVYAPGGAEQSFLTSPKVEAELNRLYLASGLRPPS